MGLFIVLLIQRLLKHGEHMLNFKNLVTIVVKKKCATLLKNNFVIFIALYCENKNLGIDIKHFL